MSTTTVGTIGLNMVLNSAGFKRSMQNVQLQANTASQKMAASFRKIGASIAAAFSAKMIASFGKSCIDVGSDLAEVQNVVDVTFSTMSEKANEWAKSAAKSYGLSETMAKKYVGLYGSMSEAYGFTEEQAYDMSTTLAGLAGDVASFYNIEQDLAYTKLKSVFSGETETLKDLGIVMTQNALDSYALANGYGKTTSAMTEAEKVTLRYKFIQDQLKNATGDFARTQDSWANQTRILQLRFDSLKATIGQGLINAFTPVIKAVNSLIDRLTTVSEKFKALTEQIFGSAGNSAEAAAGSIASAANSVNSLTGEAEGSSSALDGIADSAEKAKRSIAGFDKLNIISESEVKTETNSSADNTKTNLSPSNNLTSAMSKAIDKFSATWDSKGKKVISSIKNAFTGVKDAVTSIGNSWSKVWNNGTGKKVIDNIKTLLSNVFNIIGDISGAFTKAWQKGDLGNQVVQSIIDKWNSLIELINTVAEDFREVWNDGTGERIWGNILEIIRNCNNSAKTLREKIKEAWDKNDTGKKIWQDILGIVEDITEFADDISAINLEWLENLDLSPVTESVEKLAGAFREFLKACGDKLKTVYKNILLPLAKWTIEKGVPKLVEMLADALKGVSDIIKKISDKTLYAIAGGIAAIGTSVVAFKAGQTIANGIAKIKNAMKLFLTTISANPLLAIASAIGGIIVAVEAYGALEWENSEAKKFSDECSAISDSLQKTCDSITETFENTMQSIDEQYAQNTLIDDYQKKLDDLLQKANLTPDEMSQLTTIVTYFSNNVDGFSDTWDDYVEISGNGKLRLKGDVDEITTSIDNLIDKYQQAANTSVITSQQEQVALEKISAKQNLSEQKEVLQEKEKELEENEKAFKEYLKEKNLTEERYIQLYNSDNGGYYRETGGDYYRNVIAGRKSLDELKNAYNETTAQVNKLTMTNDDLSDVLKVLNGDYSDAAAVMMAYNSGMINLEDIQNSQWKTLAKLEKSAKDTGKNTVIGLVEGTEEYKGALIENSNGLANLVLSEYDKPMGIQSPSREMHERGAYTVAGLVNGLSDNTKRVQTVVSEMVSKIKTAIDPIKNVFANAFGGIWSGIQSPMNFVLGKVEDFVNNFNSGLSRVGGKILNGVDVAANIAANVTTQNLKLPRLAKGGIVKAPTLAVVGDNAGANTGNPEVIAPLNKLQTMINNSGSQDVAILSQILDYLKRIYEMFIIFRNNGGNMYEFVAKINGSEIFKEIVNQNELYKKRHNGKSAFL